MAAEPGLPTGHADAPLADGIGFFMNWLLPGSAESSRVTCTIFQGDVCADGLC